jgi:2-desacetyl-2-hydroxyethyl bacteriochlorophyllide A dehydrogenase
MRAVEIAEDRRLVPVEREEAELAPGHVRVEVAYCGICGSDLHLRPSAAVPAGTVMGHEFAGRVLETGPEVERWAAGDRVAVFPFIPCGECPLCAQGDEHVCVNAAVTGIGLGANQGAYAERVAVPAGTLFRLPDGISDRDGALAEPLAVGVHGVALADVAPDAPVAVIGAGPIGVMTALALRAEGFERVVVVERNERRAQRMRDLGFAAVGLEGVHMAVLEGLGSELPHAVFECAGHPAALGLALELVRPTGRIVALGVLEEAVPISQLLLIVKEAQIRGSFAYRRADFARAIDLLEGESVPTDALITGVVELERAEEMFGALLQPDTEHLKVLLRP